MTTAVVDAHLDTPYVGPVPFSRSEHDRSRFFGRTAEIEEIVSLVYAQPQLCVHSASGAGKTSLVNAGVLPRLADLGFEVLPPARVRGATAGVPDGVRCRYMFEALQHLAGGDGEGVGPDDTLASFLAGLGDEHRRRRAPRVLVFDQFEEILSIYSAASFDEQADFFTQLAAALDGDPLLRVAFLVREDHLAQVEPFGDLLPNGLGVRYRLERLDRPNAREAIVRPAELGGRSFTPDAANLLIERLARTRAETRPGEFDWVPDRLVEPVQIQLVCESLWRQTTAGEITADVVREAGDVGDALARHYDDVLRSVARTQRLPEARLRRWFEDELITPMRTRGTAFQGEETTEGLPNAALRAFEDRHVVRGERRSAGRWYELVHDSFIDAIQASNRRWWYGRREVRRRRRLVGTAAAVVASFGLGAVSFDLFGADDTDGYPNPPLVISEAGRRLGAEESDRYSFDGTAGDDVTILVEAEGGAEVAVSLESPGATYEVEDLDPGTTFLTSAELTASGAHEVVVRAGAAEAAYAVDVGRTEGRVALPGRTTSHLGSDDVGDSFTLVAAGPVLAEVRSDDFDPVVTVSRADGEFVARNDDNPFEGLDSLLAAGLRPSSEASVGVFHVTVTPYSDERSGDYELVLTEASATLTPGATVTVDTNREEPALVPVDPAVRSVRAAPPPTAEADDLAVLDVGVATVTSSGTTQSVFLTWEATTATLAAEGPEGFVVVAPGSAVTLTGSTDPPPDTL